jgi:hypothetical protein
MYPSLWGEAALETHCYLQQQRELRRYHISYKTGLWAGISASSFLFTLQASERALPFQADEQVKGFQLFTVYFSRRAHSFTDREGVG